MGLDWSRRRTALLTAAIAGALVAGALVLVRADDEPAERVPVAEATPSSSPSASPEPVDTHVDSVAIWPMTTAAEIAAWQRDRSTYPFLGDREATILAFAKGYLGIADPYVDMSPGPPADGESNTGVADPPLLCRRSAATRRPVCFEAPYPDEAGMTGVESHILRLDDTVDGARDTGAGIGIRITSPLVVSGTHEGPDRVIDVELRASPADGGTTITRGRARVRDTRWSVTLAFETTAKTGSVLAIADGGGDGGIAAAAAAHVSFLPVGNAGVPSPELPAETPPEFVAVDDEGRLGLYETDTGRRVRRLTSDTRGDGVTDPSITPDGLSVVYVHTSATCTAEIRRVPIAGGTPTVLVPAQRGRVPSYPVLSARGELAYSSTTCSGRLYDPDDTSTLVVGTKQIPFRPKSCSYIRDLAWSADGARLAVVASVGCDYERRLLVVDPARTTRLGDAGALTSPAAPPEEECSWTAAEYDDAGRLAASESCGNPGHESAGYARLVTVEGVVSSVALPAFEYVVGSLDVDASGKHLVLGTLACGETCEDAERSVHRYTAGGKPVKIADGLIHPAWVA